MTKHNLFVDKLDSNAASAIKYPLHQKPGIWADDYQQGIEMSKLWKFSVFYILLLLSASSLLYFSFTTATIYNTLNHFWGLYFISQCWGYMIAGLGLAIPVAITAFGLGWLQLYLMIHGQIEPHLTSKGFGSALETIFTKVFK